MKVTGHDLTDRLFLQTVIDGLVDQLPGDNPDHFLLVDDRHRIDIESGKHLVSVGNRLIDRNGLDRRRHEVQSLPLRLNMFLQNRRQPLKDLDQGHIAHRT